MVQVLVRELDKQTIERLKQRARNHGRTLQAELKSILEGAVTVNASDVCAAAARFRERFAGREFSDSADLIREDRDR
jgi:plasmid stability protein